MLIKVIPTLLVLAALFSAPTLYAQEGVPSEKRALIKELLVATDATKNAGAIMSAASAQMEKDVLALLSQAIEVEKSLPAARREELQRMAAESAQRAGKRFQELLDQRINYSQLVEEVSYEVYNRHYTTDELRDLLAFYKTPTGHKTVRITPQLFSESMAKTSERLMPVAQQVMREIVDEETKRIEKLLPARAPRRRKRPRP